MKKVAILNIYQGIVERGSETLIDNVSSRMLKDFDLTMFSGGKNIKKPYKTVMIPFVFNLQVDVSRSLFFQVLHRFYLDPYSLEVFWFTLLCLPKLLRERFDIIFSVNGFWQMVLLRFLRIFKDVKIVSTGFAGVGRDSYWNLKLTSDGFVAMTNFAAKWAKEINPKIKVFTIGGGVDLKRFRPNGVRARINLEKPIVLCVSALVPYKKVDLAIEAVSKLKKGSLLVIGDGYEKERLQSLGGRLLGSKRFRILKVSYSKIEKFYRACDVFTLPSESSEAFGIVYLESMACGKPIVAPNDEVRREIVDEAGILVNVKDTDDYSKALKEASEKKWLDLPRKQAAKFSWDIVVKRYKKALNQI